jgi:hypothetical protein
MNDKPLNREHIKNIIELCDDPKYLPRREDVKSLGQEVLRLRTAIDSLIRDQKISPA